MRGRLPHPRHHRREGRRRGVARRPRARPTPRTSRRPTSPSRPRASSCPPTCRRSRSRRATGPSARRTRTGRSCGSRVLTQVAVGVSATVADAGDRAPRRRPRRRRRWPARSPTSAGPAWPGRRCATCAAPGSAARWRCSALYGGAGGAGRRGARRGAGRGRRRRGRRVRLGPALHRARAGRPGTRRSPSPLFGATGLAVGPLLTGRPALAAAGVALALGGVRGQPRSASRRAPAARGQRAPWRSPSTASAWRTALRVALGAGGRRRAWPAAAARRGARWSPPARSIGRWLFYVTVVPRNMPGSFWRGAGSAPR